MFMAILPVFLTEKVTENVIRLKHNCLILSPFSLLGILLKLIIATIIYWGTITVFFILIIPIYRLFTIYKGRVNNKVW